MPINPHNKNIENDNWTTPKWVWETLSPMYIEYQQYFWVIK